MIKKNQESISRYLQFYNVALIIILYLNILLTTQSFCKPSGDNSFSKSDSSYNALKYILSKDDLSNFKNLKDANERIAFINTFWKQYNPDPSDSINVLRNEFESRINYAITHFSLPYKKGWKTDRGRIIIIYGKADEVVISPFASEKLPPPHIYDFIDIKIWFYDKPKGQNEIPAVFNEINDGRMFFVFAKYSGRPEYIQIYSTEPGEKIDPGIHFRRLPVLK